MRLARIFLLAMFVACPISAGAVDLNLGAMIEGGYDSNIYRSSSNRKGDGSFRFTPTIGFELPGRTFSGDIYYLPTYEVFTTYSDANGLTHEVFNHLSWLPSEKTDVRMTNRFRAVDVLNFGDPDTIDEGVAVIPDNDIARERVYIFGTGLAVNHAISSRWTSNTTMNFDLFESERRLTADSKSVGGFQSFDYGLTASDEIGAGGGFTAQFFDEVPGLPASNTYIAQIFASYVRHFGERTTVSVQLGPAYIFTSQNDFSRSITTQGYPYIEIDSDTTVGEITSNQNIPIADSFGQNLTDDTPVLAGSVVVPDAGECLNDGMNPVLFEGSRCSYNRLLRNDATYPDEQAPIATIVSSDDTEVEIAGSNQGTSDSRWTLFGEVAITQMWLPTLASTLAYTRSESSANGLGASAVADAVLFRTTWKPSELWDLQLRASYVRRENPNDLSRTFVQVGADDMLTSFSLVQANGYQTVVEESSSVDTHRWGVVARAARRITRHITASVNVSYADQRSQHTSRNPNDFGTFLAYFGVEYDFDPFRF